MNVWLESAGERSDAELIREAQSGHREAFAELYRRHEAVVYRFACAMTGSSVVAEDVVQEVFLTLMRDLTRYDPVRAALPTYLYGVARNISRARARKDRRFVNLEAASSVLANDDPAARISEREDVRVLRVAIRGLPAKFREVLVLCDLHELDYAQVAVILRVPVGTVRSRLSRARQQIQRRMHKMRQPAASVQPVVSRVLIP